MKKLMGLVFLFGLGACHRGNPNPPLPAGTQLGAASPTAAVAVIFKAAKDGDIQALSTVWGDTLGAVRDRWDRTQLEERGFIILRCLRNDSYMVVSDGPGQQGARMLVVQVTRSGVVRSTPFTMVKGPQNRWYFFDDPSLMQDLDPICKQR